MYPEGGRRIYTTRLINLKSEHKLPVSTNHIALMLLGMRDSDHGSKIENNKKRNDTLKRKSLYSDCEMREPKIRRSQIGERLGSGICQLNRRKLEIFQEQFQLRGECRRLNGIN